VPYQPTLLDDTRRAVSSAVLPAHRQTDYYYYYYYYYYCDIGLTSTASVTIVNTGLSLQRSHEGSKASDGAADAVR